MNSTIIFIWIKINPSGYKWDSNYQGKSILDVHGRIGLVHANFYRKNCFENLRQTTIIIQDLCLFSSLLNAESQFLFNWICKFKKKFPEVFISNWWHQCLWVFFEFLKEKSWMNIDGCKDLSKIFVVMKNWKKNLKRRKLICYKR